MKFQPILEFKEIKEDTNEKEKERKLEDRKKWQEQFSLYVNSYFEEHEISSFHRKFDSRKDKLDCFVPASGSFVCHVDPVPGKKPRKKVTSGNEDDLEIRDEVKGVKKNGCGRYWGSDRCLDPCGHHSQDRQA